jgi:hypothetical protein
VADAAPQLDRPPLPLLELAGERQYTVPFRDVWPTVLDWVEPFYDAEHLRRTVIWMLRLDPAASEALLVAALTHDMERHFPGGTQPDKAAGAWDDVEYNTRHTRRSAVIVSDWLRRHGMSREFVDRLIGPILEHEFGGSAEGNLIQASDSLSFLDTNASLVARWVLGGETTVELGKRKLEWMYERIQVDKARELARPLYEAAVSAVDRELGRKPAR